MQLEDIRREYRIKGLTREDLHDNPIDQFTSWMEEAIEAKLLDPTAMVLATASASGQANARTVLLKGLDHRGFVFFTSYSSTKGREIAENPQGCLLFPWHDIERQVRIQGRIEKISPTDTAQYFQSRPRESQIAACASEQSAVIDSRQQLLDRFAELERQFGEQDIPVPADWGGYRLMPEEIEFWQGRENRLHDRFRYRANEKEWVLERMSP
jgi:pyridoxamine 5'-phosphate oxidase